jgi:hypothetical protein
VATRDIRPSTEITVCDVCGRTLLRGEWAEAYIHGGARRWVCELCKSRALHEGWVREGTAPAYDAADFGSERQRSLLSRLRSWWERETPGPLSVEPPTYAEHREDVDRPPVAAQRLDDPPPAAGRRTREPGGEPRHVRAVPASVEQKTASAIELFNASEHPRTVAGVARSLGLPGVCVLPSSARSSLMTIVVRWELCWYRYEVDLSDEVPAVQPAGQGYELNELSPEERVPNAVATEQGTLEHPG